MYLSVSQCTTLPFRDLTKYYNTALRPEEAPSHAGTPPKRQAPGAQLAAVAALEAMAAEGTLDDLMSSTGAGTASIE